MTHLRHVLLSCILAAGFLHVASPVWSQQALPEADRIIGVWLTADGKAHIEVSRTGEQYSGKIIWLAEPEKNGKPVVDDKNPDEALRGRPILLMELMFGFVYDGDNTWVDGRVYDPEDGDEYRGKVQLVDDSTMELRGYVLIPLFGRTETWTRVR